MNSRKVILCNLTRKDSLGHKFEITAYFLPEEWIMTGRISGQETVKLQDFTWKVHRIETK